MRVRAAVLVALLLTAAGCGADQGQDSGNAEYVGALNRAQSSLAQRFTALEAHTAPTSSAAQDTKTLLAYEAAVRDTVAGLRKVDPPPALTPLHRRFVAQVEGYGAALRTARGELRGGDPQAILAAQGRLRSAVVRTGTRLNATIAAINRKLQG
jgi:hypothetical protein